MYLYKYILKLIHNARFNFDFLFISGYAPTLHYNEILNNKLIRMFMPLLEQLEIGGPEASCDEGITPL